MKKLISRSAVAAVLGLTASAARAGGDAPATNLEGTSALFMLIGGVVAMSVAIWILTIIIGKIHASRK